MISSENLPVNSFAVPAEAERLNLAGRILVNTFTFLKIGMISYKLAYFERMLNFLRITGLKLLSENELLLSRKLHVQQPGNFEERICRSATDFLVHFGIVTPQNGTLCVHSKLRNLYESGVAVQLIESSDFKVSNTFSASEKRMISDYLFVREMIRKYRNPEYSFRHVGRHRKKWEALIANRELDYEIRLSETLSYLTDLIIPQEIKSPFDEAYYTESGRNAFKNFTQFRFPLYFKEVFSQTLNMKVLDMGCGYGNYIELLQRNFPMCQVTGIEKNTGVYEETLKKFNDSEQVNILNEDFFTFSPAEKFNAILLNYVLFYFNYDDKKTVLTKALDLLEPGGSIILCQYFSGIGELKKVLARKQGDLSLAKRIEMYYSEKILYANTLWNDAVDTFAEAVQWDEFNKLTDELGLEIASMTNADSYYYSLFIEVKKQG